MNDIIPEPLLRYWIDLAPGCFSAADLSRYPENQQAYIDILERFVKAGILDHHGDRRGWYRPRQNGLEKMDYKNVESNPLDVWLPFGLSDLVELYENSIIIVSGAPNSGKTAVLLNMIRWNAAKEWDIHYFNSEMSAGELRKRLELFYPEVTMSDWTFNAYARASNFADVVFPGPNQLNIIDFLEIHDEFYIVGRKIKEIHDRLNGGIAVIALQKNPGADTGLGGYRSLEVTRLALAIDSGVVKVSKAKNFRTDRNPNGLKKNFKLVDGCKIIDKHGWFRETEK
jgi:hypothetical protein